MTTKAKSPESTRGELGQGIYSLGELRLYLSFYAGPDVGDRALRWLREALNPVAHRPRQADYSFSDLVSLLVVHELVKLGVKLYRIQEGEEYLRRRHKTDRPYATNDIATDGVTVFTKSDHDDQVEMANQGGGQQVQKGVLVPELHHVQYEDGYAVRWMPSSGVSVSPDFQFGDPVVEGTRVPTGVVLEVAEVAGESAAASRLGLTVKGVNDALKFERALQQLRS